MTALQPRVWAEHDQVAHAERRPGPPRWRLGVLTGDPSSIVAVRFDDGDCGFYSCDDRKLVPIGEVPLDERHWLPERVRDQLMRQEAAEQLRAMRASLPVGFHGRGVLEDLADMLDDLIGIDPEIRTAAARALLTPAPTPAPTPH